MLLSNPTPPQKLQRHPTPTTPPNHWFSDARTHGYDGPTRTVRMARVVMDGGGSISNSPDGLKCAVTGPGSLRILRFSDVNPGQPGPDHHKATVGRGGHRIDASRNMWEGSGLKLDSASTDVVWGSGIFENKILTSARNGELIMWDLNKSSPSKYERRAKDHLRSIHQLALSKTVAYYCITGSADGDLRVWDLRDLTRSIMRVHHPTSVRSVAFSPSWSQPLHAIAGLDNGSILRWDLRMGQRGQLDKLPVAHTGSVMAMDWSYLGAGNSGMKTGEGNTGAPGSEGHGWLVTGGLDSIVKVWDLTSSTSMPHKPAYTLHPPFPVRSVKWRPGYECEVAIVSNAEFSTGSNLDLAAQNTLAGKAGVDGTKPTRLTGDAVEIWDVRKPWIAKWSVCNSAVEGGVTGLSFRDPHALWVQHVSGAFSQLDLRDSVRPIDAVRTSGVSWDASGSLSFVVDSSKDWDIPYDDMPAAERAAVSLKWKLKRIGDKPYTLNDQFVGTFVDEPSATEVDTFVMLAKRYTLEGKDKQSICAANAEVAWDAGKYSAAQAWDLLSSLLTSLFEEEPRPVAPRIGHSVSAPGAVPTSSASSYFFPPLTSSLLQAESAPAIQSGRQSLLSNPNSPRLHSQFLPPTPGFPLTPGVGNLTRSSSNSATSVSPRKKISPLPPIVPLPPVPPDRRASVDSGKALHHHASGSLSRRNSKFRRPSHSTQYSTSTSDRSFGSSHTRNVGDGTLDDSDSDESEDGGGELSAVQSTDEEEEEEEDGDGDNILEGTGLALRSFSSSSVLGARAIHQPSPLSRKWTDTESQDDSTIAEDGYRDHEDITSRTITGRDSDDDQEEEEEHSASPRSTDTESGEGSSPGRPAAVSRRHSSLQSRRRTRRNSAAAIKQSSGKDSSMHAEEHAQHTQGEPIANLTLARPGFHKNDSGSSLLTVIGASERSGANHADSSHGSTNSRALKGEATLTPENFSTTGGSTPTTEKPRTHSKNRSATLSELILSADADRAPSTAGFTDQGAGPQRRASPRDAERTNRDAKLVKEEEGMLKKLAWSVVTDSLEALADEGDIQTCAMISIVAGQELKVPASRLLRFVEGYIDLLFRLKLHVPSAYIRKLSELEDVSSRTQLETTIYTSCGKCRKPLVQPAGASTNSDVPPRGGFAYCLTCRTSCVKCAICRLPVRTLLLQCAVCAHGGHQECYQRYYGQTPLVEITPAMLNRTNSSSSNMNPPPTLQTHEPRSRSLSLNRTTAPEDSRAEADDPSTDDEMITFPSTGTGLSSPGPTKTGFGHAPGRWNGGESNKTNEPQVLGYPCAAGCGHFCWASSKPVVGSASASGD